MITESGHLTLHCNATPADRADLIAVPLPERTESYTPVPHIDLVTNVEMVARKMFANMDIVGESYGLTKDGKQMFGLLKIGGSMTDADGGLGRAIGFRNSYDKTMSVSIAFGLNVFVCDNLVISGSTVIKARHTGDVQQTLINRLAAAMFTDQAHWDSTYDNVQKMKDIEMPRENGYEMLGLLAGQEVLKPQTFTEALREWRTPSHEVFAEHRTAWSLYNACTFALKRTPIHQSFQRHEALHKAFTDAFVPVLCPVAL